MSATESEPSTEIKLQDALILLALPTSPEKLATAAQLLLLCVGDLIDRLQPPEEAAPSRTAAVDNTPDAFERYWAAQMNAAAAKGYSTLRDNIMEALKAFAFRNNLVEAKEIWVTPAMEACFDEAHKGLPGGFREGYSFVGLKPHWDATEFKLA